MSGAGTKQAVAKTSEKSDELKRVQIPIRTTPTARNRLASAAAANSRSLTQEIEQRLEHSLRQEDEVGGSKEAEALHTFGDIMRFVNSRVGPWTEEPDAWEIVSEAVIEMLALLRPTKAAEWKPQSLPDTARIRKALSDYEAALAAWEPEDRQLGNTVLKYMLKARTEGPLTDEERAISREARERRDAAPPQPLPALEPQELETWRGMEQWKQALRNSAAYASAIVQARFQSEARRNGA
jgi:hypothetical protein